MRARGPKKSPPDRTSPRSPAARLPRATAARAVRALCAAAMALMVNAAAAQVFDSDTVDKMARALAAKPYAKAPPAALPKALKDLTYDQIRDVRFDPSHALWRAERLPFELQFSRVGGPFIDQSVKIHEVVDGKAREIPFDPDAFDYGKNSIDRSQMRKLGYAGFRAHYALHTPRYKDEVVVFLGPSYFRALGQAQRYGASARGLAIDTAESGGEEFPRFEQFWIERPASGSRQLVLYALLDSRRATGAYRFTIRPGE